MNFDAMTCLSCKGIYYYEKKIIYMYYIILNAKAIESRKSERDNLRYYVDNRNAFLLSNVFVRNFDKQI